jgi:hypothetical protein
VSTLIRKRWIDAIPLDAWNPSANVQLMRSLGVLPPMIGGSQPLPNLEGYNAAADIVTRTADGFDLNAIWQEFQVTMALQNQQRQQMVSLLTFPVTTPIERVPQISGADFEKASEYGEPRGIRPQGAYWRLGYDFDWYDIAARFTWKFLADAPVQQVNAINAMVIEADNRLVFNKVMEAIFRNTNRVADIDGELDVNVYALYNADGTVPPRYKTNTFNGSHTHYWTTNSATIDSTDLDDMMDDLDKHGYTMENGVTKVFLMNRQEAIQARAFNRAGGDVWDFIPAQGTPGMLMPADVILQGQQPSSTWRGLNVIGSYGGALIVQEDNIPPGYFMLMGTGGPDNLQNPVGIREHANPALRGLRLVKGPNPDYPLIDSFYQRAFGTGIRQRGGVIVNQVVVGTTYTAPTFV